MLPAFAFHGIPALKAGLRRTLQHNNYQQHRYNTGTTLCKYQNTEIL